MNANICRGPYKVAGDQLNLVLPRNVMVLYGTKECYGTLWHQGTFMVLESHSHDQLFLLLIGLVMISVFGEYLHWSVLVLVSVFTVR